MTAPELFSQLSELLEEDTRACAFRILNHFCHSNLRAVRNKQVDVIGSYFSRYNMDLMLHTDLPQNVSRPFGNLTGQHALSILRYPNKMNLEIVLAMTVQSVTSHGLLVANATSNNLPFA